MPYAVSRAESIQLLCGTARAKIRSRTSVEASQNPRVFNAPGGVIEYSQLFQLVYFFNDSNNKTANEYL